MQPGHDSSLIGGMPKMKPGADVYLTHTFKLWSVWTDSHVY